MRKIINTFESWWNRPFQEILSSGLNNPLGADDLQMKTANPRSSDQRDDDKVDSLHPTWWNKINFLISQIFFFTANLICYRTLVPPSHHLMFSQNAFTILTAVFSFSHCLCGIREGKTPRVFFSVQLLLYIWLTARLFSSPTWPDWQEFKVTAVTLYASDGRSFTIFEFSSHLLTPTLQSYKNWNLTSSQQNTSAEITTVQTL